MRNRKRVQCSRQRGLRNSAARGRDGSLSLVPATRPSTSGEPPSRANGWFSQRSLPASPESCFVLCSRVVLARRGCVSRRCCRATGAVRRPCASAPPRGDRSPRAAPAFGSCLACSRLIELRVGVRSLNEAFRREASCLAQVRRGKLALMVRQQSVLHQPPNPSIERTANGGSRSRAPSALAAPSAAAHVQR